MVREFAAVCLTALCGASRPHVEGSSMLQVSDNVKVSDREEYLLSMKQKVLDFARDGVPDNAKPFLQQIRGLLETEILGQLTAEKGNQKSAHDAEFGKFETAWLKYDGTTYDEGPVTAGKSAHSGCRDTEHDKWDITQTCDNEESTAQGHYDRNETAVKTASGRSGVCQTDSYEWATSESLSTYKQHVGAYKTAIEDLIAARTTLVAKQGDCQQKDGELSTQKGICDGKQTEYENAACTYALAYQSAITTYNSEYSGAKSSFESESQSWQASSENRVHQCQTVHTVICYINALEEKDIKSELEDAVTACDGAANSYDTECAEYEFIPSDVPDQQATRTIPPVCGQEGFSYFEAGAPEGTAVVSPCNACNGLGA